MPFSSYSFRKFTLDELPLERDTWVMDEAHMVEWETVWLKVIGGDEDASPYKVGCVTPIHIAEVTPAGAEISWYANTADRFHEIKTFLPRDAFVAAALAYEYEKRVSVFVRATWLRALHLRSNSIFAMIDAVDMTHAIKSGAISHEKVIRLRDALDEIAARHPYISFISFADSLLIKTNWTVGMVDTEVKYTYAPEGLFRLFKELQGLYRATLGLEIYGVFAQGSNEYYDDPLLHISEFRNHISLNSLGLPFAQISLIEAAARRAIRAGEHARMEIYMDEDLFHSLRFEDYERKSTWPSGPYKPKMSPEPGRYFYAMCDDLMSCIRIP
ncbi:hypothetical protein [Sphingomonas quercus]|uniref:Uncharacterized protein n=1 Tax=Sphingomonas quercus TaxID=2842451 RepID=A0ABS6BI13_9SPHN|nr:hypothetical protein [Sphingomonas quercus]MBU3077824.1 hypothetical protein [Sphingomonas quercus]